MREDGPMPNWSFWGMSLWLRLRERLGNPRQELMAGGLERGQVVLDYGCGVGSFALPAAQIVGQEGTVYALDIHPLAIQTVERRARNGELDNIKTIRSERKTGLPDGSVDVVLVYDVLHAVQDKQALLEELHRVLKPGGDLWVKPDHMSQEELLETMRTRALFSLKAQRGVVFEFAKNGKAHSG